jgi:tRNA (guanosine-2'-O-)-methyltransferase
MELTRDYKLKLINYLAEFVTENKQDLIEKTLEKRSNHMTVVLEDIFQSHNASAVIRTCDCFGVQNAHIIENRYKYSINSKVMMGSEKWVNLNRYKNADNNTIECYNNLKNQGYKIVATTPHINDCNLEDFDYNQKFALVFGTEKEGLSKIAIENADAYVKIPMYGFTESLNISVTAALFLHYLAPKIRNEKINWKLSEDEKIDLKLKWFKRIIRRSDLHEKEFLAIISGT